MADKSFGVKEIELIGASGTPTIESPNNLEIKAVNVAISTDITVGGMVSLGAGTSISSPGTNVLTFGTNSTEKVRILSNGRVAIGGVTANSLLDVHGGDGISITSSGDTFLQSRTTGTTGTNYLEFKDSGGGAGAISYHHNGNSLRFKVNGSERLRIDSDGKIGLDGMTNPVAKLHIGTEDDSALTAQTLFVEGAKTGYANYTGLPQNQLCIYDNTVSTAGSGGAIGFGANCGGSQQTWIAAIESQRDSGTNDASNYAGSIVFWTRPAQSTPTEKLRILSSGGITFNGDTASANALDDYEEGTWTPTYESSGASFTYSSTTAGNYIKIGRMVFCRGTLRTNSVSGGTAGTSVSIGGLPFTVNNNTHATESGYNSVHVFIGASGTYNGEFPTSGQTLPNTTTAALYYRSTSDGNTIALTYADLKTGTNQNFIKFSLQYEV